MTIREDALVLMRDRTDVEQHITAARAMLAALKACNAFVTYVTRKDDEAPECRHMAERAIAQAEAAGIKAE